VGARSGCRRSHGLGRGGRGVTQLGTAGSQTGAAAAAAVAWSSGAGGGGGGGGASHHAAARRQARHPDAVPCSHLVRTTRFSLDPRVLVLGAGADETRSARGDRERPLERSTAPTRSRRGCNPPGVAKRRRELISHPDRQIRLIRTQLHHCMSYAYRRAAASFTGGTHAHAAPGRLMFLSKGSSKFGISRRGRAAPHPRPCAALRITHHTHPRHPLRTHGPRLTTLTNNGCTPAQGGGGGGAGAAFTVARHIHGSARVRGAGCCARVRLAIHRL
jgi:hypothetical protein